jgi:hypothetical protein
MPSDSYPAPVGVKIARADGCACDDAAARKGPTETIVAQLAVIVRAMSCNRAAGRLFNDGMAQGVDVGERAVNGQTMGLRIGIGARSRNGRVVADRHLGWGDGAVDPSWRIPFSAEVVLRACARREAAAFVDDCEARL